jgi:hypothetical protein
MLAEAQKSGAGVTMIGETKKPAAADNIKTSFLQEIVESHGVPLLA